MSDETISVGNFQWSYAKSARLTGNRNPTKPEVDGLQSMDAKCPCGARWEARKSATPEHGHFTELVGGLTIICPRCGREDGLPAPQPPE